MAVLGNSRVSVAPQAIAKASRLFNASLSDILNELFQNSRRARASAIQVSTSKRGSKTFACVEDDGDGIFANGVSIALGGSGWDESVQDREDPFGGGIFSLAHRGATFEGSGVRVSLSPEQFAGERDYAIEDSEHVKGTRVTFPLGDDDIKQFSRACETAALYFPLPVELNGDPLTREDFLELAIYREVWEGIEIGVVTSWYKVINQLNFYGVVVEQLLARVSMVNARLGYGVRANVLGSPRLKLVLPARKEVFQDEFFAKFKLACERAIYRAIATLPDHTLAFSSWQRAKNLGVNLKEALPLLPPYSFPVADYSESYDDDWQEIADNAVVVTASLEPPEAQTIDRAMFRDVNSSILHHRTLFDEVQSYKGYSWYDALPRYESFDILVETKGEVRPIEEAVPRLDPKEHVERILVRAHFVRGGSEAILEEYETDVALWVDPDSFCELRDARVVIAQGSTLHPDDLADLLFNAVFSASEDSGADSYSTQQDDFMEEAHSYSFSLLVSEEEAVKARIAEAAKRHLWWLIPKGRQCVITIDRNSLTFDVCISAKSDSEK